MKNISFFIVLFLYQISTIYGQFYWDENASTRNITPQIIRYYSNLGFSAGKIVVYNGYHSLLNELHDTDLAVLTPAELRILRNTVFASKGMIFQSDDLTAHFSRFDWYRPENRNVDDRLSNSEREIISRIQAFENLRADRNVSKSDLVGIWHGLEPVAAAFRNIIEIRDDNTIEFGYNEMHPKVAIVSKGTYSIENGFLVVFITEQTLYFGGYFHSGYASLIGGMNGARLGTLIFDEPVGMVFPIVNAGVVGHHDNVRQIGSQLRRKLQNY